MFLVELLDLLHFSKELNICSSVGKEVSDYASDHGYTSIGVFAGHGIGTYFHGPPDIFHICKHANDI